MNSLKPAFMESKFFKFKPNFYLDYQWKTRASKAYYWDEVKAEQ
jgi:hypothetical protein